MSNDERYVCTMTNLWITRMSRRENQSRNFINTRILNEPANNADSFPMVIWFESWSEWRSSSPSLISRRWTKPMFIRDSYKDSPIQQHVPLLGFSAPCPQSHGQMIKRQFSPQCISPANWLLWKNHLGVSTPAVESCSPIRRPVTPISQRWMPRHVSPVD